jgi:hypothetical protein
MIEYVMILGFVTALIVVLYGLLYPAGADDIETLINSWGDKLATQIAGDEISADTPDAIEN